jgi:hypothetical protein
MARCSWRWPQALSLGCYAQLYRQVLAALGARVRFRLAADVTLATFFVSHLTPFGSATGTLVNASTLETEGIAAATTGEAIALTSLTSTIALIVLFGPAPLPTSGSGCGRVPMAKGKAKESPRRRSLADGIPSINFLPNEVCSPGRETLCGPRLGRLSNAEANIPIAIGSWPATAISGAVVFVQRDEGLFVMFKSAGTSP